MRATCTHFGAPLVIGASGLPACARCDAPLGAATSIRHTQHDGERPAGAGRVKFLRLWRRGHEAGDPGVWSEGRARCMSPEAWARLARTDAKPRARIVKLQPKPRTLANDVLSELGATRKVAP